MEVTTLRSQAFDLWRTRLRLPLLLMSALLMLILPAAAQKRLHKDLPINDARQDPYTRGEAELWEAAGIHSMGGFEFGNTDTAEVDSFMATSDILWIETEHFELGFALGPYKVNQKEKKKLVAELEKLSLKLPAVNPKAKILDPWLRTHLFAQRLEESYDDFLGLIQLEDSVFPDGTKLWDQTGTYHGEGPYLGQKGKYEVLILPSEASLASFLSNYYGLRIKKTQRWNIVPRDTLTLTIHIQQGYLKVDTALHGHVAFNMFINFFDGFEHYSYETPHWIREGLAHWAERRVSGKYNTFDGAEGSVPEMTRKSDWEVTTRKLVVSGKQPRMAALMRFKGYGDIELDEHFAIWSMIDYLYRTKPKELAGLIQGLNGRMGKDGSTGGENMSETHRELFKQQFGMSYAQFDTAWVEWVLATY